MLRNGPPAGARGCLSAQPHRVREVRTRGAPACCWAQAAVARLCLHLLLCRRLLLPPLPLLPHQLLPSRRALLLTSTSSLLSLPLSAASPAGWPCRRAPPSCLHSPSARQRTTHGGAPSSTGPSSSSLVEPWAGKRPQRGWRVCLPAWHVAHACSARSRAGPSAAAALSQPNGLPALPTTHPHPPLAAASSGALVTCPCWPGASWDPRCRGRWAHGSGAAGCAATCSPHAAHARPARPVCPPCSALCPARCQ